MKTIEIKTIGGARAQLVVTKNNKLSKDEKELVSKIKSNEWVGLLCLPINKSHAIPEILAFLGSKIAHERQDLGVHKNNYFFIIFNRKQLSEKEHNTLKTLLN